MDNLRHGCVVGSPVHMQEKKRCVWVRSDPLRTTSDTPVGPSSARFVRPAAQSIRSCARSVPEVNLTNIELARLGTFLCPTWFGTVRHSSARFGHTPRGLGTSRKLCGWMGVIVVAISTSDSTGPTDRSDSVRQCPTVSDSDRSSSLSDLRPTGPTVSDSSPTAVRQESDSGVRQWWPKIIHIQLDNTKVENKNEVMVMIAAWMAVTKFSR